MSTYCIDYSNGNQAADGSAASPKQSVTGVTMNAGDEVRLRASYPQNTGYTGIFTNHETTGAAAARRDDVIRMVGAAGLVLPVIANEPKRTKATWTRSSTTITATKIAHGLSTGDWIWIACGGSSSTSAIAQNQFVQITVTSLDVFTFTGLGFGDTAGDFEYTCRLCEPRKYGSWVRVSGSTTITVTQNGHGYVTNDSIFVTHSSNVSAVLYTTVKVVTRIDDNTFSFTGANAGALAGALLFEPAWVGATANTTVASAASTASAGTKNFHMAYLTMAIVAAFTTGKTHFLKFPFALDLSTKKALTSYFSIVQPVASSTYRFALCSDTAGNTPITGCDWTLPPVHPNSGAGNKFLTLRFIPRGTATVYTANQAVNIGDKRYRLDGDEGVFRCVTAGTTHATIKPYWKYDGSVFTDGSAEWVFDGWVSLPNNVRSLALYMDIDQGGGTGYTIQEVMAVDEPNAATSMLHDSIFGKTPTPYVARNTAYNVGDFVSPSAAFGSNKVYRCLTAGTTHSTTEPDWDYHDNTLTTDGSAVFECVGFKDTWYNSRFFVPVDDDLDIYFDDYNILGNTNKSGGYMSPIFPPLLTVQAEVGDDHLHVDIPYCKRLKANDIVRLCLATSYTTFEQYTVASVDALAGIVYLTGTVSVQRAVGSILRYQRSTEAVYQIHSQFNTWFLNNGVSATVCDYWICNSTDDNPITMSGGWNADFTAIDGETWVFAHIGMIFHQRSVYGTGMRVKNIGVVGAAEAFSTSETQNPYYSRIVSYQNIHAVGTSIILSGIGVYPVSLFVRYLTQGCTSSTNTGMKVLAGYVNLRSVFMFGAKLAVTNLSFNASTATTIPIVTPIPSIIDDSFFGSPAYGTNNVCSAPILGHCGLVYFKNIKTDFGSVCSWLLADGQVRVKNLEYRDVLLAYSVYTGHGPDIDWASFDNINMVDRQLWYCPAATAVSDTDVYHGATNYAIKTSIRFANPRAALPIRLPFEFPLKCVAGQVCTGSLWFRRDNTGIQAGLFLKAYAIEGVGLLDLKSMMTADADVWEKLSISFTPTESGVVHLSVIGYGGTTYSFYISDFNQEA